MFSQSLTSRLDIFFALTSDGLSDTSFLQYCPRNIADSDTRYSKNITLLFCENTARFIKLRLYFGGKWLLLTEISFNSGILLHYFNTIEYICQFLFNYIQLFCLLLAHYLLALYPTIPNTAVKRLRMCELSFELRFFFRTYKVVLKPFYCFSNKK